MINNSLPCYLFRVSEIEDLNLNLTGTLTAPDESSGEDDDLTRDLKRKHRRAKRVLLDISAKYKAVKRRLVEFSKLFTFCCLFYILTNSKTRY